MKNVICILHLFYSLAVNIVIVKFRELKKNVAVALIFPNQLEPLHFDFFKYFLWCCCVVGVIVYPHMELK